VPPTATPVPPTATAAPPTKPPTPTAAPGVKVPDIRGQSVRDAQKILAAASLQLGESHERCEDIGASETKDKLKKGQIRCQSPVPGSVAVPNTPILYVLVR
jgi:beta-lactam-binding protein with PASTA domain